MEAFEIQDESEVMSYYRLREQLSNLSQEFQSWLVKPQYLVPFLQAGNFFKLIFQKIFLCEINCLIFRTVGTHQAPRQRFWVWNCSQF